MEVTPQPKDGQKDVGGEERREQIDELSKSARGRYAKLFARLAG
jgi:hypothetical protein